MSDFVLIDTDILIEVGRGTAEAVACLRTQEEKAALAVSVITC